MKFQKSRADIYDIGGANLQLWPSTKYFKIHLPKSVWEWHKGWFNAFGLEDDLPPLVNEPHKCVRS